MGLGISCRSCRAVALEMSLRSRVLCRDICRCMGVTLCRPLSVALLTSLGVGDTCFRPRRALFCVVARESAARCWGLPPGDVS